MKKQQVKVGTPFHKAVAMGQDPKTYVATKGINSKTIPGVKKSSKK